MSDLPPARDALDPQYQWDLARIFPSDAHWQAEYEQLAAALPELAALRGSLGASAGQLLRALRLRDRLAARVDRLQLYASLLRDQDTSAPDRQAQVDRVSQLQASLRASAAFLRTELLALPEPTVEQFVRDEPDLAIYRFFLAELRRQQAHIQSPEVERVLALAGPLAELPLELFGAIKDADFAPPVVTNEAAAISLTHGSYWATLRGADRRIKRAAYQAYTAAFQAHQHALAAALAGAIKRDVFLAQARGYPSALHAALHADAIPAAAYDQLISTVRGHAGLLQRYLRLCRRALGLETLCFYDIWGPLTAAAPPIGYDTARATLLDALSPLGQAYAATLGHALYAGRSVDVYETAHKRSGASCSAAYGLPPYLLLNWRDQLNDLYGLAHEAGHAMHTSLAHAAQPYVYSDYGIFLAEVAAIGNEALLTEHLLATAPDPQTRRYVLSQQLQRVVELLFWQALFAEFDGAMHAQVEAGRAITAAWLSATLGELMRAYFGDAVEFDERATLLWAQFPHFYLNFYVWKFATGMVAALALTEQILSEGPPAAERYLAFLCAGASQPPIELLRAAGVDLTTPQPVEQAMQVFAQQLDRLELLLNVVD